MSECPAVADKLPLNVFIFALTVPAVTYCKAQPGIFSLLIHDAPHKPDREQSGIARLNAKVEKLLPDSPRELANALREEDVGEQLTKLLNASKHKNNAVSDRADMLISSKRPKPGF